MKKSILFATILFSTFSYSQNVGIGTASPTNKLDVSGSIRLRETSYAVAGSNPTITIATDVSQAQLTAGASPSGTATITTTTPQDGQLLAIYNNSGIHATLNGQTIPTGRAASFVYSATGWRSISDPNLDWKLTGNSGTTPSVAAIGSAVTAGSNFIGTTDAKDLVIATNNGTNTLERMRITSAGNVGIGTTVAGQRLTVVDAGNGNQYNGTFSVYANNLTQGVGIGYAGIQALGSNANQDLSFNARGTGNITMQVSGTTGNVGIGTSTVPSESRLVLGALDATNEGGELQLNAPGGSYTTAHFIDNYQNSLRILTGTNTGSTALRMSIDNTGQVTINNLAGTGNRKVFADANGMLNASSTNVIAIYNFTTGTSSPNTQKTVITNPGSTMNVSIGDIVILDVDVTLRLTGGSNTDDFYIKPTKTGTCGLTCTDGTSTPRYMLYRPDEGGGDHDNYKPIHYMEICKVTSAGTLGFGLDVSNTGDDTWEHSQAVLVARKE